jgi:hypothetical protein
MLNLLFPVLSAGNVSDIFEFSDSRLTFSEFQIPSVPFTPLPVQSPGPTGTAIATFVVISDVPFTHIPGKPAIKGIWGNAAFVAFFSVVVILFGLSCVLLVAHLVRRWRFARIHPSIEREMMDDIDARYLGPEPDSPHD